MWRKYVYSHKIIKTCWRINSGQKKIYELSSNRKSALLSEAKSPHAPEAELGRQIIQASLQDAGQQALCQGQLQPQKSLYRSWQP